MNDEEFKELRARYIDELGVRYNDILSELNEATRIATQLECTLRSVEQERDKLRAALVKCGRAVGASLTDDVSSEFLCRVPDEVKLHCKSLERVRDEAEQRAIDRLMSQRVIEAERDRACRERDALVTTLSEVHAAVARGDHGPAENAKCIIDAVHAAREESAELQREIDNERGDWMQQAADYQKEIRSLERKLMHVAKWGHCCSRFWREGDRHEKDCPLNGWEPRLEKGV